MRRTLCLLAAVFVPTLAGAQTMPGHHHAGPMPGPSLTEASAPTQPGQAAFAAIQEIVEVLESDPSTDWAKVNVEALRQHLIDMDNVTLRASVQAEPAEDGMVFIIIGDGPVRDSIRRMTAAHAAAMNGAGGWRFAATPTDAGARLTVHVPPADRPKLAGLGFIGVLTRGMHHQEHHLMLARGGNPHH